jgi:hypothetical protein
LVREEASAGSSHTQVSALWPLLKRRLVYYEGCFFELKPIPADKSIIRRSYSGINQLVSPNASKQRSRVLQFSGFFDSPK